MSAEDWTWNPEINGWVSPSIPVTWEEGAELPVPVSAYGVVVIISSVVGGFALYTTNPDSTEPAVAPNAGTGFARVEQYGDEENVPDPNFPYDRQATYGDFMLPDPADRLNTALVAFTGCIGESLADLCSYGLTIGETYVPFNPDPDDDCDEDEAICSQAWVRVMGVTPTAAPESFGGQGCGVELSVELEVGVLRCLDIPEGGEAPTATDVMAASMQAMSDMQTIYCAAMACEVWESIESGSWAPEGPLGGQYGGTWTFTVEV